MKTGSPRADYVREVCTTGKRPNEAVVAMLARLVEEGTIPDVTDGDAWTITVERAMSHAADVSSDMSDLDWAEAFMRGYDQRGYDQRDAEKTLASMAGPGSELEETEDAEIQDGHITFAIDYDALCLPGAARAIPD